MEDSQKYMKVTAEDQNEYLCPISVATGRESLRDEDLDDCVEADVAGRYIGNIRVATDN